MKIAVQGCAHGDLDIIYSTIEYIEKQNDVHIDLLLCCGDFQSSRNLEDVKCMAAPEKYHLLCSFYKYYSGEKIAPKLTIFIGGNHEASNYLQELPYGGWVAPNIYYLGYAGVVNIAGIRIAGLSGIYKENDYSKGRYEKPPYSAETMRSCYHVRNLEIFRLKQLSSPLDVMMSHDWPNGIVHHGNLEQLLRYKPYLKEDIDNNDLGNSFSMELLQLLKPNYWFAAHLHAKFAALVSHDDSINKMTKFLALDKVLPRKRFLQILDIPHDAQKNIELEYDLEWLTVLHLTNHLISIKKMNNYMPGPGSGERWKFTPTKDEMESVLKKFDNTLVIPKNFVQTAPPHSSNFKIETPATTVKINPQTVELCRKLCIDDPMDLLQREEGFGRMNFSQNASHLENSTFVDSETDVSTTSEIICNKSFGRTPLKLPTPKVPNVDESSNNDFLTSTPLVKSNMENSKNEKDVVSDNEQSNPPVVRTSEECNNGDETTATPRTFKRRNIAMYRNNDEDD